MNIKYDFLSNSIIKIKVTGKNIDNYLKKLIKDKVSIIKLTPISRREAYITIRYKDYLELKEHRTIYELETIEYYGILKLLKSLKKISVFLIILFWGLLFLWGLSNVIFDIEIIHSDKEIREFLITELKNKGIDKYKFKKKYSELEQIEDELLAENKDKLEWIEIIEEGTKYIVKLEERIINEDDNNYNYQDIVSIKNATITKIEAQSGEKIKKVNQYVKKGETVISGTLTLPDGTIKTTTALGKVYGEVWYRVDVTYPYIYYEEKPTGAKNDVYVLKFLGKRIELFNFNKFQDFHAQEEKLLFSNLLPLSLVKEKQLEVKKIESLYTEDVAHSKAIDIAKDKLLKDNDKIQTVLEVRVLKQESTDKTIYLNLFVKVEEEISEAKVIEESLPETTE